MEVELSPEVKAKIESLTESQLQMLIILGRYFSSLPRDDWPLHKSYLRSEFERIIKYGNRN
jgi:hypothetical protein